MAREYVGPPVRARLTPEQKALLERVAEARREVGRRPSEATPSAVLRELIDRALEHVDEKGLITS